MDGLLCNPSVLSFFKPPRSGERVQGTSSLLRYGAAAPSLPLDGLHRNPSLSYLLQTAAKRRWESEGQSSLRRGLGRQPHHSPSMDCIAIHPSPAFFKPPRSEERVQGTSSLLGYGAKPHRSPPSPSSSPPSLDAYLSPFHHRRTRSARKRIKLPVRHVLDSVVRLHRTRRRRSRRRYAVAMRRRHAPA